jgi:hypothetical protein
LDPKTVTVTAPVNSPEASLILVAFFKKKVARAGERTQDLLISFIFSFHHFTAEPQRLP